MAEDFGSDVLLEVLNQEGKGLLELVRERGLEAEIPQCPGWTVRDLAAHVGFVYRWVATIVGEKRSECPDLSDPALVDPDPADDHGLVQRLENAQARLIQVLRQAAPEVDCWTLWPTPNARHFWIRRQVHETVVHRSDAQNAGQEDGIGGAELDPAVAADGVDEMIRGYANCFFNESLRTSTPATLMLHSTDSDRTWWIKIGPEAATSAAGSPPVPADTEVHARSGELLLLLWNRRTPDGLDVRGKKELLEVWRERAQF